MTDNPYWKCLNCGRYIPGATDKPPLCKECKEKQKEILEQFYRIVKGLEK
jgi:ABC-type ATPase with predicted acetyltransferase domain